MILLVPSAFNASGLTTYLLGMTSVLEPTSYACVASPTSDLARRLPREARLIPTDGSRDDLADVLRGHKDQFRIVQTHGRRALLAALLARWPTSRLAHLFHEIPSWREPRSQSERVLASRAHLAANAPETARRMRTPFRSLPAVLPPILDHFSTLPRSDARARLQIADGDLAIGVIGRLAKVKRPELALEAAASLPGALRAKSRTVFLGDGPLRGRLETEAAARGIAVSVEGPIPDARVLLAAFDVVVAPSPHETFGLALGEAILAGISVVAVDSPGTRFLTGGALPVAKPSASSLADRLERVLTSNPARSESVRDSILHRFGPEAGRRRFRRYFEELQVSNSVDC